MARSSGKTFEINFEKSIPDYVKVFRIPDPPQSFYKAKGLRFSRKNPFDLMLWDSKHRTLYALELKTVDGKSISFEREANEKGSGIHRHQADGLREWNTYDGIHAGFVIEFREIESTIFLEISEYDKILESIKKKSFTLKDLDDYDVHYTLIQQKKVRVNYRYDVDTFLNNYDKSV